MQIPTMKSRKPVPRLIAVCLHIVVMFLSVKSLPLPEPDASPSPQLQFPVQSSRSSQQFTMYKPVQLGYSSTGPLPRGGIGQDFPGNPLHPVFHYNYNISHQPNSYSQQGFIRSGGPIPPGITLTPQQVQYLRQEQQQRGLQPGQPLQSQYQQQYQQNQNYAPVIIANPNIITRPSYRQPQSLVSGRGNSESAQFFVDSDTEREDEGIGFRLNDRNGNSRKTGGNILFDQRGPSQQFVNQQRLQYPDNIVFSNNGQNHLPRSRQGIQLPYNTASPTTIPTIHVPYITTPSTLQKLQNLQKNPQQAIAGFRSQLGLVNPASIQSTSLNQLHRNSPLNLSPAIRTARVQNIVVPVTAAGQTPAGTRLIQQDINGLQQLQNAVARTVYAHQGSQGPFIPTLQSARSVDLSSPNLHILKGIAITPENQRDVGHIIFSDPNNPTIPAGGGSNAVLASTAQKVFILPQGDGLGSTDSENAINFDETPAEIIVTVVDEDESNSSINAKGERGKVLSNFSLFLLPTSYKKCVEGYRRAHDGKCRLIIKLRGRSRVYLA